MPKHEKADKPPERPRIDTILSPSGWPRLRAWVGPRNVVGIDNDGVVLIGEVGPNIATGSLNLVACVMLYPETVSALAMALIQHMPPQGAR